MAPVLRHFIVEVIKKTDNGGEYWRIHTQSPDIRTRIREAGKLPKDFYSFGGDDTTAIIVEHNRIRLAVCSSYTPEFRVLNDVTGIFFVRGRETCENRKAFYIPANFKECAWKAVQMLNRASNLSFTISDQTLEEA